MKGFKLGEVRKLADGTVTWTLRGFYRSNAITASPSRPPQDGTVVECRSSAGQLAQIDVGDYEEPTDPELLARIREALADTQVR